MTLDERAAALKHDEIVALLASHDELKRQNEWFKKQLFGVKSERRVVDSDGRQLSFGELSDSDAPAESVTVGGHTRRQTTESKDVDDSTLRFDESVPVEEIRLGDDPEPDDELISEKITYRLAQRPGAYVVLKFVRPVIKKADGTLSCPAAPRGVLGKSCADVSLLAGMAIEKFRYHLPLYRQHQRLKAAGIRLARSTLTSWMQRTADLLGPIYQAQLRSILASDVLAMDETPIKAGRSKTRRAMKAGYFWPIYGDRREVAFPFAPSRSAAVVKRVLGEYAGVLLSDGYKAYESYAAGIADVVHAQCWAHVRRQFVEAEAVESALCGHVLERIGRLYAHEARLTREADDIRRDKRARHCAPIVDELFAWLKSTLTECALLPSNPWTRAARYALDREAGLRVFLEYPAVPIDTNHLEREIRPVAIGRKNWLFCWTELGARDTGIFHSLLATCRLQDVDPYTWLVDVLQRIDHHPMSEVATLTPRLWKEHFADQPLWSDLEIAVKNVAR